MKTARENQPSNKLSLLGWLDRGRTRRNLLLIICIFCAFGLLAIGLAYVLAPGYALMPWQSNTMTATPTVMFLPPVPLNIPIGVASESQPADSPAVAYAKVERLRVYSNFGSSGRPVVLVAAGVPVTMLAESPNGDWRRIRVPGGIEGWARTDRLLIPSPGGIPVPAIEPSLSTDWIIKDDLTDPNSGLLQQAGDILATRYDQGQYVVEASGNWGEIIPYHPELALLDCEVMFAARVLSGEHASYGLVFRNGYDGYYVLETSGSGYYSLQKSLQGRMYNLIWGALPDDLKPGEFGQWRVVTQGSKIAIFVNGQLLNVISDNMFDGGSIGLHANIRGGGAIAFDYLEARPFTGDISLLADELRTKLGAAPTPTPTPLIDPTPVPGSGCRFMHIFRPGDTSFRIELRYGTPFDKILEASGLKYVSAETVGEALCIP